MQLNSAWSRQLPSHRRSRALIYNLTRIEFILLRVDDQGKAGRREEGGPSNLIFDTGSCSATVFDLFLSLRAWFFFSSCFISLTQTHNVCQSHSGWHTALYVHDNKQMQSTGWLGEKQTPQGDMCNVQWSIYTPRLYPESFPFRWGLTTNTKQCAKTSEYEVKISNTVCANIITVTRSLLTNAL